MTLHNTLVIGLSDLGLTAKERQQLTHPAVAGVILFARNYETPQQLIALTQSIKKIRHDALIGVDQEGGRVQRFLEGFTRLPAAYDIGQFYDQHPVEGLANTHQMGLLMANELYQCGVNLCFAPVADLYTDLSSVIGTRAFHANPEDAAKLVVAYFFGMKQANVMAVAKHFPGHGSIAGDTHVEQVMDTRSLAVLQQKDLIPFAALIDAGVPAVMAAHVVYPQIDSKPAGFSSIWLKTILRDQMNFTGCVFSDDMGMQAAKAHGDPMTVILEAKAAGCDRILLCNEFEVIDAVLQHEGMR
jgi:beta-N-acetylhexosaminidase